MKLSEKIAGKMRRQGRFRLAGFVILAMALASLQAAAQQPETPLATAGESLIAPELAQAHPVIAQYHWSKLPNHAGKPKYGGTLHLDLRSEPTNWDPFSGPRSRWWKASKRQMNPPSSSTSSSHFPTSSTV